MGSTFSSLELIKRSLTAHQQAIHTTGHNISNADNPDYARQRVNFKTSKPLYAPSLNRLASPGMIGQGVEVGDITRIRDHFVDSRIRNTEQDLSYWKTRENYYQQVEIIINEPSEQSIRNNLDTFWASWQNLSQYPDKLSHREVVLTNAKSLTYSIRDTFGKLSELRLQADREISIRTGEVNNISKQIASLNVKIKNSQTLGDSPNDLLDNRDKLLDILSSYVNVSSHDSENEFMVYLGGNILVQGMSFNELEARPTSLLEGLNKVIWKDTQKIFTTEGGALHSLIEFRDVDLKEQIEKMDLLAINLADGINQIHRDGFGLNKNTNLDFFDIPSLSANPLGDYDFNGDGVVDTTTLFRVKGKNKLKIDKAIGISGTMKLAKNDERHTDIYVSYESTDTVRDVIQKINDSFAGVSAYLNHENEFVLKGNVAEDNWKKNFLIRHLEDDGDFLVSYTGILQNNGSQGAFDYRRVQESAKLQPTGDSIQTAFQLHAAGFIDVSYDILNKPMNIAATSGKDVGGTGDINVGNGFKDGTNALKIAQMLKQENLILGDSKTIDQFYNAMISKIGSESKTSKEHLGNTENLKANLENLRQSVMGVNLDEEMARIVQFQNSYNAAARVLTTINDMIDRLINQVG